MQVITILAVCASIIAAAWVVGMVFNIIALKILMLIDPTVEDQFGDSFGDDCVTFVAFGPIGSISLILVCAWTAGEKLFEMIRFDKLLAKIQFKNRIKSFLLKRKK